MKKLIALLFTATLFLACESENTGNVSKVTNYPVVTLNGERTVILNQGDTYTELGANALAGDQTLPTTITGTVDTTKPNVYKIEYKAVNEDGFPASVVRSVVVVSTTPSTIDLSGTWLRNGVNPNNVIKISDRVYKCDNATGFTEGSPENITLTFYNLDDKKIYAPYQENTSISGISAESNVGTIASTNQFSWIIYASSFFGTAERIFKR